MKSKCFVFILAGFLFLLCQVQVGNASVVNRFVVDNNESGAVINLNYHFLDFINIDGLTDGWSFGVYDYGGEKSDGLILLDGSNSNTYQMVLLGMESTQQGYLLKGQRFDMLNIDNNRKGVDLDYINLGDTPDFSFYFYNGEKYYEPTALWHLNPSDVNSLLELDLSVTTVYLIRYEDDTTKQNVFGLNLAPVPLPATIMLLGSSLMGLLIVGNRKKG